jgi:hypothetical protein
MRTAVQLFVSSMIFAVVIAALYWMTTHDIIGVVFLGIMALALIIVASYIFRAEREANLAADSADIHPAEVAGENLGAFSFESYWPIVAALGSAMLLSGIVLLPGMAFVVALLGAAIIAWSARFLLRESSGDK